MTIRCRRRPAKIQPGRLVQLGQAGPRRESRARIASCLGGRTCARGSTLNSIAAGRNWVTVAVLAPNRTLVLRSTYQVRAFRTVDPKSRTRPERGRTRSGDFICARRLAARPVCNPEAGTGPSSGHLVGRPAVGSLALHQADPPVRQPAYPRLSVRRSRGANPLRWR
jgi:hypothetical protein